MDVLELYRQAVADKSRADYARWQASLSGSEYGVWYWRGESERLRSLIAELAGQLPEVKDGTMGDLIMNMLKADVLNLARAYFPAAEFRPGDGWTDDEIVLTSSKSLQLSDGYIMIVIETAPCVFSIGPSIDSMSDLVCELSELSKEVNRSWENL